MFVRYAIAPLVLAGAVVLGMATDRVGAGLAAGVVFGLTLAALLATQSVRQLRRIVDIAERGREGVLSDAPQGSASAPADRALFAVWRLASHAVRTIANNHAQIAQQGLLIDRMPDGMMRVAANGTVLFANVAAASLFGGRNPTGRSFLRVTRDHELNEALRRCLTTGVDQQTTLEIPGDRRLISASIYRLPTEPVEALVLLRDVTEMNRLQTMRRDFVANVSHELRTPLSTVKLLTETLLELRGNDEDAASFLRRIDAEVDAMSDLVRDLLELARLENQSERLVTKPVSVARLIDDVSQRMLPLAERQGVCLLGKSPDTELTVVGDERRLHQALLNLVRNAIDHTPRGGEVRICGNASGGEVVLRVSDTGVGIHPDDLPRIWERFYKIDRARAGEGTGLGLAIVKHIAQAHGGSVAASSEPGEGSTFEIWLPRGGHHVGAARADGHAEYAPH